MAPFGLLHPGRDHDYGSDGARPAWLDIDWSAHVRDVEVDGLPARVADVGSGDPLVLVHGLGAAWQCWLEQFPAFMEDHRVIAMDLPGFGRSPMPEWDISIDAYGAFVVRLLEEMGVEQAALVGNSMGGFIGAEVAIRRPELVSHLALVSPAILWQEYRRAKPLLALAQTTEAAGARAAAGVQKSARSRPRLRHAAISLGGIRYPHLLSREMQHELIRSSRRTAGFVPALGALANFPIREELPDVQAPTLLVWGKHDTLVHVKQAREVQELIPNCETVLFERTGHVAMVERPERFNRVLREFLEATPAYGDAQTGAAAATA
jgi:pimeloyl-ACP methyl ester carboxylesterase